jgi:hypothetical protein
MKNFIPIILIFFSINNINSQYTEIINSNRPGTSQGAFSVGKNVLQFEFGASFSDLSHENLNFSYITEKQAIYTIRYGLLFEKLELIINGSINENLSTNNYTKPKVSNIKDRFINKQNVGFKFLVFDPYKNKRWHSTSLTSWKKNNSMRWIDLIPAISVYAGANYVRDDAYLYNDPFSILKKGSNFENEEKQISFKGSLITQHHFLNAWVLVNNFSYDRIGNKKTTINTISTLTHNFTNPKWSSMVEFEFLKNDIYSDYFIKSGLAYLLAKNYQLDASIGTNFKSTPSLLYINFGLSTRLDWHKDVAPVDRDLKKKQRQRKKLLKTDKKGEKKSQRQSKKNSKKQKKIEKKSKKRSKRNS